MNDDKNSGLRINKAIAQSGICSRRRADALIRLGLVRVDGAPVTEPGLLLRSGARLEVEGRLVDFAGGGSGKTYLMLNKPIQVVSTASDPEGRETVLDYVPENYRRKRFFPVGRLDYFSEGLLLLTDDGELTQRLTHPSHHLPKYYEIIVRENPPEEALETMRRGMTLAEGEKLAPLIVERRPGARKGHLLAITLRQGINRQLRRMCRDLGLTILRLRRTGQGPLRLEGLKPGQCRELGGDELKLLREAAGLPPSGQAAGKKPAK